MTARRDPHPLDGWDGNPTRGFDKLRTDLPVTEATPAQYAAVAAWLERVGAHDIADMLGLTESVT